MNHTQTQPAIDTQARTNFARFYDQRMFDELTEDYYGHSGFMNFGFWTNHTETAAEASANLVDQLIARIPHPRGSILDVACGTGATTRHLARAWPAERITAVNISTKQLCSAAVKVPGARFAGCDAVRLPFADASFDDLICVEAAFHFRTRETFLAEAHRVLKPGGVLVLSDALISPINKDERPHWDPANMITDFGEYEAVCRRAGFADVDITDATNECWHGCFWNVVRFAHGKFLKGEISVEQLNGFLDRVYRLTTDLERYVLVALTKSGRRMLG